MNIKEELNQGKTVYNLPLKVVFYARVSTENELQSTSIINQVEYFTSYIENNRNWILVKGYVDEGISGKSVKNRKNFLKMIDDAKNNKFNLILTKSVSRFARNTIDSINYTELLAQYGVGVLFLNDNINTFYTDSEFRLTLMASIAQDELRKLSESVQFGLNQSINRGIVLGNNNIFGYKKNHGELIVIDKEAQIVRKIYNLYATKRYNYLVLSKIINQKYQLNFDSKRIKRILTNPKYKGYYCGRKSRIIDYKRSIRMNFTKKEWLVYRDYKRVPPIVKEELWDKVNSFIDEKEKEKEKNVIPFKDIVFCNEHKKKLMLKRKKYKNVYYNYLVCKNCISISTKVIDKIWNLEKYVAIIVGRDSENVVYLMCKKE